MTLHIRVEKSPQGHWEAHFDGRPQVRYLGSSPKEAILKLVKATPEKRLDLHTIVAADPEGETRLKFAIQAAS